MISGAEIDIWHADDAGNYDNQGMNLRGKVLSNSQGFYLFETVFPGKYLNGNAFRPAHIHFKITPPGYPQLTTQLYFQGDTSIPGDAAASITSGTYDATHRIVPTTTNAAGQLECTWDIVLDGDGQGIGNEELRSQLGMIYQVSPNPFNDVVKIHYGVFQEARVQLQVFDIQGRLIADLEESSLSPDKFEAEWRPSAYLADGYYFIALKINDFQVHYLKVCKKA